MGTCLITFNTIAQEDDPNRRFLMGSPSGQTVRQIDTLYLNLKKLLEVGGANNPTIELFKKEQDLALADQAKAREWWLPEIYAGLQVHKLWGATMNADGGFFLDVHRDNMWSGLGVDAQWDFGEGIYQLKSAALKAEAAGYKTQAEKNQVLLKVIHTYYDFLTAQLYNAAYAEMVGQADTIVAQLQTQVEVGIRFQSEMLLAKSSRNHLMVKALEARNNYREAMAELVNLLNVPAGVRVIGLDTLLIPLELIPETEWRQTRDDSTFLKRPEYRFLNTQLNALHTERKTTTTGLWLPELSLSVNTGGFGGLFDKVRPMRPAEFPNPNTLFYTTGVNASLMWRIPLGRLTYGGRLKQFDAQMALQQNQISLFENQVNEEVAKARSQLLMASEQLELAEESQSLAGQAVEQSIQRQKLGTAKPFEVFQAQEFYLRARVDYLNAIASYNKAQYSLYIALGNNL